MSNLIYLYCVTNKLPPPGGDGYAAYSLHHDGLYAVVSHVPEDEFAEENLKKNLNNLEWLRIKAFRHEKVIEDVMNNGCVVPFKLATLFKTEDTLRMMLKEHADELRGKLEDFEEKEEWGGKLYCDRERLKDSFFQEDQEILKIDKEICLSTPGKAYLLKKKREQLIDEHINAINNGLIREFLNGLEQQSLKTRLNRLLTREATDRRDDMILNAAFLVDKTNLSAFIREITDFKQQYEGTGYLIDCTGPWPPYNFC